MKKRQREILRALHDLGGVATTKAIAEKTFLHVNGVSQSLSSPSLFGKYVCVVEEKRGGDTIWKLIEH